MLILENKLNFKNQYKIIRNSDENTMYMKVDENDETNSNTQSVRSPHIPSIANTQLSPSGSSARKRETPRILSRMFPPFAGITYPCVTSPLAQRIIASCFVLHLIALLFIVFPLRYFFPVGYIEDNPFFLPELPGKPPLDHQISPTLLYTACIRVV